MIDFDFNHDESYEFLDKNSPCGFIFTLEDGKKANFSCFCNNGKSGFVEHPEFNEIRPLSKPTPHSPQNYKIQLSG